MRLPRNLVLVYLVVVGTYTAEGFISVVLSPYLQHQGVPLGQIGAIVAAMSVASLISRLPAGMLYRPGRANVSIALAAATVAAATFFYPRSDSDWMLGGLRLLHGFAFGVSTTLNMAQFFDVRPADFERGRAMGIFAACLAGGNMLGNVVGGWWADRFGFEAAFTTAAIFPLVAAAINLQIRQEPGTRASALGHAAPRGETLRRGLDALRNPGILLAALLLFCLNVLNLMFVPFFNLYGLAIGLSLTALGFVRGFASFSAVFTRVFAGELGRWFSYNTISRVGITLSAAFVCVVPLTTAVALLLVLVTAVSVLRSILTVTGGVSVMDATATTAAQRGVASGIFNMGKDLGSIAGPFCGGVIAGQVGVGPMMQVVALATLALFWGGTALLEPRLRHARIPDAVPSSRA
ncbi:MAG TPA: MFS transporter [Chloroflexota bacterium]|nr:MFS transporter [Chloroflexota bacterium]